MFEGTLFSVALTLRKIDTRHVSLLSSGHLRRLGVGSFGLFMGILVWERCFGPFTFVFPFTFTFPIVFVFAFAIILPSLRCHTGWLFLFHLCRAAFERFLNRQCVLFLLVFLNAKF